MHASLRLRDFPLPIKVTVSTFVLLLAGGCAAAVWHHWFAYADVDGKPGLRYEDLRMALHGEALSLPEISITDTTMWRAIHDIMRKYFRGRRDFKIVEAWLLAGATETTFDWPWTLADDGPIPVPAPSIAGDPAAPALPEWSRSPAQILRDSCVSCHGPGGARSNTPLNTFAAVSHLTKTVRVQEPQRPVSHSVSTQVAHTHLLTIPVFALILSVLFYLSDWPEAPRSAQAVLSVLPMIALAADSAMTIMAPINDLFVIPTLAARTVFLIGIAIQIISTLGGLWQPGTVSKTHDQAATS